MQSYLALLSFGPRKRTLLIRACSYSRFARVRELVEMGARLEAQDVYGSTALSWTTILGGDTAIIAFLLDRGAVIEHRDNFGSKHASSSSVLERPHQGNLAAAEPRR